MKATRHILLLLAAILVVMNIGAKAPDPLGSEAEKARAIAKARYIYLEAAAAKTDERYDDYYMLLRRAAALDPGDPFIAGDLAELDMLSPYNDSLRTEQAYEALKRRFKAAPSDLQLAGTYLRFAGNKGRLDDLVEAWSLLDSVRPDRTDVSLNLAEVLVFKSLRGDTTAFDRALTIYDRLLGALPGDVGITSQKIRAFSARRDTTAIVSELQHLIASAPDNIQVNLYAGNTFGAMGMPDSALKYFDHALELEPESGEVFINRAQFFSEQGDSAAFDREVFNALAASDLDFEPKLDLLLHYARALFEEPENRTRVRAMFEKLLETNPGEARLHSLYAAYELTQDNYEGAHEQYTYAIDLDPSDAEVWGGYLTTLSRLRPAAEVLDEMRRAIRLFPDNLSFRLGAAGMLSFDGDRRAALDMLDSVPPEALSDPQQSSSYHTTRGDLLNFLEMRDSAYTEYTEAIRLNPHNAMAMNNMAYFMALDSVNLSLARTYASLAVSEDPENPTYLDTYAWVEFRRKDFPEAKRLIDLALAAYGEHVEVEIDSTGVDSREITIIHKALEGTNVTISESEEADEEAIELDEDSVLSMPSYEIYDHAGDIYFWNGLLHEAAEFWEKASMLKPDDELIKKKAVHKTYFAQ
ncbi:MAG: hypothetical protein K2L96_03730 [Muribaculaceae bacterium]|nr:hypothetical protein [Muribaculaceae bacterium]